MINILQKQHKKTKKKKKNLQHDQWWPMWPTQHFPQSDPQSTEGKATQHPKDWHHKKRKRVETQRDIRTRSNLC